MKHNGGSSRARPRLKLLASVAATIFLGGCVSFSQDAGLSVAQTVAYTELNKDVGKITNEAEAIGAQQRVEELLRRPLTPDAAVQIAFLKNRGLQAAFNDLGVSEATYVQASLPPSPRVVLGRSGLLGGASFEVERQLLIGLFELATLPQRSAVAQQQFRAAQFRTAEAVLSLGAEARRQYYRAIAANQRVAFMQQALVTAETASELAKQLGETGALNKLEQAREHAFYQEIGAQLAQARIDQKVERERLIRQLGLWGRDIDFSLPGSLPSLPSRLASLKDVESEALSRRVDLQAMRNDLNAVAGQYSLDVVNSVVSDIELVEGSNFGKNKVINQEGQVEVEKEKTRIRGIEASFTIPIFDFGESTRRGAQEAYMAAANRLAERAVNVRSEAREAYVVYRGKHDLARHYQSRVLPLQKRIQDEALLQYSGMLVDVSQLIIDARTRILSNVDAINARRDFWIAATDLKAALVGGLAGGGASGGETTTAAAGGEAAAGGH
ncbi:TolC family protein [Microvirga mediterraneensis]|uniref:TolC family protein n=1 Tax=Microvirga mediterraneensis TaxID=2754695 RepID=A0A838BV69_9HYPH|nr:TolC family protein [Microvirga mediterraneensis]MBA1158783.1 TolC family protein [Microvirga mediterraneensis]